MEQQHFAGLSLFLLGSCGVIFNSIIVVFSKKANALANPFGILTLNQAVTDLINSTVFAFLVAPTVVFTIALPFGVTARLGQLLFLAYDCCSWTHLWITLNRFTAVFFPFYYSTVFSRSRTLTYVFIIWALAIAINFWEYVFIDCSFYLPHGAWNFDFTTGDACKDVQWYLNYCRSMSITACIAILDIATVIKFHRYSNEREAMNSQRRKSRTQKQELYFLAQAMLQSTLFYIELVCCYNLGALPFMASPWAQFGLRTIAWVATHAADGLITLICNGDFRRMFARKIKGSRVSAEELHSGRTEATQKPIKSVSVTP